MRIISITENEYCRFGGLKRFLLENQINIDDKDEVKNIKLNKKGFSDFYSYFLDEELKELKGEPSFWTEFDGDSYKEDAGKYNFQPPVEKFNATYYSHYAVIKDWFEKTEEIKNQLKNKKVHSGDNINLFKNPIIVDNLNYFFLVRKICRTENNFKGLNEGQFKYYFLYKFSAQLNHAILLACSKAGIEMHIPFYGFYSYFSQNELPILCDFLQYINLNFQNLLKLIEESHNSYMEEKYGDDFLKIKKHEMQLELNKQLEEILISRFSKIINGLFPAVTLESQCDEKNINFFIYSEKKKYSFNFSIAELQNLIEKNEVQLKNELKKVIK